MAALVADVPAKLAPLLKPARYKGAHGGRGGAKSHFFAEQCVLRCFARPTRFACIREVQNSLKESVRQLIIDKISKFGLEEFFQVLEGEIRGRNGSLIIFKGMQSYNAENIKSLEGFDVAWVEEAQTLSERSLRLLRPTIRKPNSEIWFSWNPRYDTDAVDNFFRGRKAPEDAIVVEVNWCDNPWFPDVLRAEMEHDYKADPEMAEHVWGGGYEIISEGSYFARLIAQAENEGRIGDFPHMPNVPVITSWDIGVDDYTSIWFWQKEGFDGARVIDYWEFSGHGAAECVAQALPELDPDVVCGWRKRHEIGREHPFTYAEHFFPHDIGHREWGAGAKERAITLMELGVKPIRRGVPDRNGERIQASRELLPLIRFDRSERVMHGIKRLRRYSRKFNEAMNTYTGVLHDENSHAADAFGEFAVNCGLLARQPDPEPKPKLQPGQVLLPGPPEPHKPTRIRL